MNDYNSKKRKKSFANDRLKKLRTTINNEVASSTSNAAFTPSKKNCIPHNPNENQERKKLIPVRKLTSCGRESNSANINTLEPNSKNNNEKFELWDECTPKSSKRRKVEVSASKSLDTIIGKPNSTPMRNNIEHVSKSRGPTKNLDTPTNRKYNVEQTLLKSNKSIEQIKRNTAFSLDQVTPKRSSESIKSINSVNSRLSRVKSDKSTKFSDISSDKKNFEYQHSPSIQTSTKSITKNLSSSSVNSKNYNEYFGQAMNLVYTKYFGSNQDEDKNKSSEEVANADSMDWEPDDFTSTLLEHPKGKSEPEIYFIVDTNIFLDSLSFLQGIINYGSQGGIKPVIYVPWMVFNELDYIKDNRSSGLKTVASKAIDFINKMLTEKGEKLIGQSIFEANKQMYVGKSPDDKIASCCLQVKEKGFNALLLSNDKNLRNKLIINGIPSLSCDDFLRIFDNVTPHSDKIDILLTEMGKCCSDVIAGCCEEEYGSVWDKLALLDKEQPWTFRDCLEMFKKYWPAVFREKLLKQCLNVVEKMIPVLKRPDSLKIPTTFEDFTKDCLSLCFFLMDLEKYEDRIRETSKKINSLVGQV